MPQQLYNTLTKRQELFVPGDSTRLLFYTCGPTVYDFAHIGNFRSFLFADVLRRWLESPLCDIQDHTGTVHHGPRDVLHVMNITDVGHMTQDDLADGGGQDKMEAASQRLLEAKKKGTLPSDAKVDPNDPFAIATFYRDAFVEDALALGIKVVAEAQGDPTLLPRASEHIAHMLEIILDLIEKGFAYDKGGAVYFDTQKFDAYGKLSGNTLDAIRSGAGGRVDASTQELKHHPADFLLWKADDKHLMRWKPSEVLGRSVPLRQGYPGWHIECSAMSLNRLKPTDNIIDLHSGGEDNIFPHHECEIAQSCCHTGANQFARMWVHARFLQIQGKKMSKSKGNFFTLRDLLGAGFSPAAIRLELIKTHYRSNANFTQQGLRDAQRMIEKWHRFIDTGDSASEPGQPDAQVIQDFSRAMHDDLNVSGAIGTLNAWINRTPKPTQADASTLRLLDQSLGLLALSSQTTAQPVDDHDALRIESLIESRNTARITKNWAESDRIRDELQAMGVTITDTPQGTTWERAAVL